MPASIIAAYFCPYVLYYVYLRTGLLTLHAILDIWKWISVCNALDWIQNDTCTVIHNIQFEKCGCAHPSRNSSQFIKQIFYTEKCVVVLVFNLFGTYVREMDKDILCYVHIEYCTNTIFEPKWGSILF